MELKDLEVNKEISWINISEIEKYKPESNILIWQKNLSDADLSRFQRAVWNKNHIRVYPLTHDTVFKKNEENEYKGYDLEGDMCVVTHFAFVQEPIDYTTTGVFILDKYLSQGIPKGKIGIFQGKSELPEQSTSISNFPDENFIILGKKQGYKNIRYEK